MQRLSFCILILCFSIACALKCQTEDGVTEDDVRRIIRVCMRKIGENTYGENSSEYDDDSDEYGDDEQDERSNRRNSKTENNYGQQLNQGSYWNNGRNFRSGGYGDYNNQYDYGRNGGDRNDRNVNRKNNSLTDKQTERDRACMVHCFFQEMKMTNERQFPDKHKVIQVLTKDLRDKQLREFYMNSIQECFYILELDRTQRQGGKCEFTNRLLQCLAERGKTNCEDWDSRTLIF